MSPAEPVLPKITHAHLGEYSAERYVAAFFKTVVKAPKVRVSASSRDGGLDVTAKGISVQVKHYADKAVTRPDIQRIVGAARPHTTPVFFTPTRYTADAALYASQHGVALFTYDRDGITQPKAMNRAAKQIRKGKGPSTVLLRYGDLGGRLRQMANENGVPDDVAQAARRVANYLSGERSGKNRPIDPEPAGTP